MLADPPGHHGPHRHDDDRRAHQTDEQQRLLQPRHRGCRWPGRHRCKHGPDAPSAWATNVSISSRNHRFRAPRENRSLMVGSVSAWVYDLVRRSIDQQTTVDTTSSTPTTTPMPA